MTAADKPSGVQSVTRALDLLEYLGDAGGQLGLSELATRSGLPLPTIHRLIRTLVDRGYVRQLPNRRYALGSRLIPLGTVADAMFGTFARPVLAGLVDQLGESANLAVFEGDMVVYAAQVPSRHAMRMFTEVGRRVFAHSTGVGKALLSRLPDQAVRDLLARTGMPAATPQTLTDADALLADLDLIRSRGYAVDEGEQEIGVRCVAVPVGEGRDAVALSVSGPAPRMTPELIERAVPLLTGSGRQLSAEWADPASPERIERPSA
ncbi:MAG: IclR family transcriptional regulator [Geodermatophilaceae bacterium]